MARERVLHLTKKDFVMQTFRVGGGGGQRRDKVSTGVRFIHPPSGARGECREHREQAKNKRIAFQRMAESSAFTMWVAQAHMKLDPKEIEREVDKLMSPENLDIEYGPFDS